MMSKFKSLFLTGLLFIIPFFVTVWVVLFLYNATIQPVAEPLVDWLLTSNRILLNPAMTTFVINLVAVFVVVGIILLVGFLARNVFGRRLLKFGETMLERVPLLRGVYGGVKQFLEIFMSDKGDTFKQVVLIEFPREGTFMLGFVGSRTVTAAGFDDMLNIFVPTTPNPTSGVFVMIHSSKAQVVDMTIEEAMHIIISAGVLFTNESKQHLHELSHKLRPTPRTPRGPAPA